MMRWMSLGSSVGCGGDVDADVDDGCSLMTVVDGLGGGGLRCVYRMSCF